jgi:hypothetical protein
MTHIIHITSSSDNIYRLEARDASQRILFSGIIAHNKREEKLTIIGGSTPNSDALPNAPELTIRSWLLEAARHHLSTKESTYRV